MTMALGRHLLTPLAVVALILAGLGFSHREAKAWSAGYSGSQSLYACYWGEGVPWCASFGWSVSSTIDYTKVWQSGIGGYTVVNSLTHQVKTDQNWSGYSGYFSGTVSTSMYSGGTYVASVYGWTLNGSCLIPPWSFWGCDSGTLGWTFYGNGSAFVDGSLAMAGGGWYTVSGNSKSGWFYWQY